MKTIHVIETVSELCHVIDQGNTTPGITGDITLERRLSGILFVTIDDDPLYQMNIPFKQFFSELVYHAGIKLTNRDAIPTGN